MFSMRTRRVRLFVSFGCWHIHIDAFWELNTYMNSSLLSSCPLRYCCIGCIKVPSKTVESPLWTESELFRKATVNFSKRCINIKGTQTRISVEPIEYFLLWLNFNFLNHSWFIIDFNCLLYLQKARLIQIVTPSEQVLSKENIISLSR